MTIDFYDGATNDGLFNLLGTAFHAMNTAITALDTTIPTEVIDAIDSFNLLTVDADLEPVGALLANVPNSVRASSGWFSTVAKYCQNLVIEFVHDDNPLPAKTLSNALKELIQQMEDNSEDVDASTPTATVAAGGSNVGDGVILCSIKRGDGRTQENIIAEVMDVTVQTAGRSASISVAGELATTSLDVRWPLGSAATGGIEPKLASSSLLANGDMEDEDDVDNAPDDWVVSVGDIGTTLKMTNVEVQTVAISGSPTGGHYLLSWTNLDGDVQTTAPIAWNASGATVQSELRKLRGLEAITVSTAGTSPNFTHTVTFAGQGGNQTEMTSTDNLTGGTPAIAHATTVAGTPQVYYGGKALEFDSDGAELTTIQQKVSVSPETAYAVSLWAIADVTPALGVITIDLVDGIGGTVINDSQGVANSMTFNAADLTTGWQHLDALVSGELFFRLPANVPDNVYFRIRISTAISSGTSMFIDEVAFAEARALYNGGPYAAAFAGKTAWVVDDEWTITTTNDRAGELQEWCNRVFGMADLGLLLPSDTGGAETIPDTVIA